MNGAHFHLVVNHLPIIFPLVGLIILIIAYLFKSTDIKYAAYLVFVLGAILTIPAFVSGEGAEEIAEKLPGVTDALIHRHEEMAETFAIISYALGLLSLVGIFLLKARNKFEKMLSIIILLTAGILLIFAKQTGTTGGEIRHTEIRTDAIANSPIDQSDEKDEKKDD